MKNKKKLLTILISVVAVFVIGLTTGLVFLLPRNTKADDSQTVSTGDDGVTYVTVSSKASECGVEEKGGSIYVGPGSTYTMKGGTITGKHNTFGGAVYVARGATFIMDGGIISNCEAYLGGAIYVEDGGFCYINNGTITGCYAESGGAIYVEGSGYLESDEDSIIEFCGNKKYESVVNVYVDGKLTSVVTQKTKIVKESNLTYSYEECCGYYLDENLTQNVEECAKLENLVSNERTFKTVTQEISGEPLSVNLYTKKATLEKITLTDYETYYTVKAKTKDISGEVVIPRTVNNLPVQIVHGSGFFECVNLSRIYMPETIAEIGAYAFRYCSSLISVRIPDKVKNVGEYAFSQLHSLNSLTLGKGLTIINDHTFAACKKLKTVIIPDNIEEIYPEAFKGCDELEEVILSNNLTTIGRGSFYNCKLKSVTIPDSVSIIDNNAFIGCTNLTSVYLPSTVKTIGVNPFDNCSTNLVIYTDLLEGSPVPSGWDSTWNKINSSTTLTVVYDYSLEKYNNLTELEKQNPNLEIEGTTVAGCCSKPIGDLIIPEGVTGIGNYAFSDCTGLTSITIPNSVTSIGYYAFSGCTGLTSVTTPNSVTIIGSYAFYRCTGLTEITISNSVTSIGYQVFYGCTGLTEITIPNSVTSIGYNAFDGCTGLTSITIPESVISIGDYAFSDCTGLKSVYLPSTVTTIGSHPFTSCLSSLVIYTDLLEGSPVPSGWDSTWNKINNSTTLTVVYGCSLDDYQNMVNSQATFNGVENSNQEALIDKMLLTNDMILVKNRRFF